jgi:hypothetical protein
MLTRAEGCIVCCGARRLILDTVSMNTANTSVNSLSALHRYRKESGPRPLTSSKTNKNRRLSSTSSFHTAFANNKREIIIISTFGTSAHMPILLSDEPARIIQTKQLILGRSRSDDDTQVIIDNKCFVIPEAEAVSTELARLSSWSGCCWTNSMTVNNQHEQIKHVKH